MAMEAVTSLEWYKRDLLAAPSSSMRLTTVSRSSATSGPLITVESISRELSSPLVPPAERTQSTSTSTRRNCTGLIFSIRPSLSHPPLFSISSSIAEPMAGVVRVARKTLLDELGEYAMEIGEASLLLHQNRVDIKPNAAEARDYRRMKRGPLLIRGIELARRRLAFARKCLLARFELLEADTEERKKTYSSFKLS